jgi:hypothetical protein
MNNYTSPSSPQKKNNKKIWTHKSHNIRIPWHSANPPSQIMVINQQVNCIPVYGTSSVCLRYVVLSYSSPKTEFNCKFPN